MLLCPFESWAKCSILPCRDLTRKGLIMAEGGRGEEKRVRCRKCRHTLLEEPPHRMMARKEEDEHIIPLYEDQLPDWMAEAVQEVM